jgi:hypothetical protein
MHPYRIHIYGNDWSQAEINAHARAEFLASIRRRKNGNKY